MLKGRVPPRGVCSVELLQGPRNAEHRDEVALLSGLAAAVDEYEHAPHDVTTVRRRAASRLRFPHLDRMVRRSSRGVT
jgi:hypothetical protein